MVDPYAELRTLIADAFCYPWPGQEAYFETGLSQIPDGPEKQAAARALSAICSLDLTAREELYTRTFDLNPPAAPYVGFQIWGESYQRGAFLAMMNRALAEAGVETEGELPDHLIPVLRYLSRVVDPLPELREALLPALERMQAALHKADPENPYLALLQAAERCC